MEELAWRAERSLRRLEHFNQPSTLAGTRGKRSHDDLGSLKVPELAGMWQAFVCLTHSGHGALDLTEQYHKRRALDLAQSAGTTHLWLASGRALDLFLNSNQGRVTQLSPPHNGRQGMAAHGLAAQTLRPEQEGKWTTRNDLSQPA